MLFKHGVYCHSWPNEMIELLEMGLGLPMRPGVMHRTEVKSLEQRQPDISCMASPKGWQI